LNDQELDQLIAQVKQGDMNSLSQIYQQMRKSIYYTALTISSDPHLSQDVLQETIVRIWEKAGQYKPGTFPKAWIITIARHYTYELLRLKNQSDSISGDETVMQSELIASDDVARVMDSQLTLQNALAQLDLTERQIVILKNITGLSHVETAQLLHMPYGTVLWKHYAAMRKLHRLMAETL
jgi:RNA polymerase sigma factor (sigma-70 family)